MLGIDQTIASSPSPRGRTPIGMLRSSAKRTAFRARPSGPKSERTVSPSRCGAPSCGANGYSTECVTHSRPRASKAMFIGFWMSGSAATSSIANPSGRRNFSRCPAGESASVGATGGLAGAESGRSVATAASSGQTPMATREKRAANDVMTTPKARARGSAPGALPCRRIESMAWADVDGQCRPRGRQNRPITKASRGRRWAALGGCRRLPTTKRCRGDSRPGRCGWGSRSRVLRPAAARRSG